MCARSCRSSSAAAAVAAGVDGVAVGRTDDDGHALGSGAPLEAEVGVGAGALTHVGAAAPDGVGGVQLCAAGVVIFLRGPLIGARSRTSGPVRAAPQGDDEPDHAVLARSEHQLLLLEGGP